MSSGGAASVQITLHWSDRGHWDPRIQRACRVCRRPTNLRDIRGAAAHKRCIEGAIEAKVAAFAQSLIEAEVAR